MSSPRNSSSIYFDLFSQIEKPSFDGRFWICNWRQFQLEKIFNTLQIETKPEDWQFTINSHKVIMNRAPKHDKLVIGCGNIPKYSEEVGDVEFIDNYGGNKFEYRHKHSHSDADTIDPDFARNPTFVAEFGETPMHELFNGHKYKEILIEGIRILPWDLASVGHSAAPYTIDSLIALLDKDGIVNDNECDTHTKAELENYRDNTQVQVFPEQFEQIDPLSTWEPSLALKNKAADICNNSDLCDELEDFLEKYKLTQEELNLTQEQLDSVLSVHSWINFEYYFLRPSLPKISETLKETQNEKENKTSSAYIKNAMFNEQSTTTKNNQDKHDHLDSYRIYQ